MWVLVAIVYLHTLNFLSGSVLYPGTIFFPFILSIFILDLCHNAILFLEALMG